MKRLDRQNLLQRFLAVEPGTARRDISGYESCTIIRRGWLYTFNGEISCAIGTALETNVYGAVSSQTLISYLKTLNEGVIEAGLDSPGWLQLNARGKQVVLPLITELGENPKIDSVDRVKSDQWQSLDQNFLEAIALTSKCTQKYKSRKDDFARACVHITPNWLEASDNRRLARYELVTFVSEPCLVRATTLKAVIPLGFNQAAETERWLHFRNPLGLRMSVRKFEPDNYPDLGVYLAMRGRRITLPNGLKDAARRASIFAPVGRDGRMIEIRCSREGMQLKAAMAGIGASAEVRALPGFTGQPLQFRVAAELLAELADDKAGTTIEVSEATLRYSNGPYTYLTSLERTDNAQT